MRTITDLKKEVLVRLSASTTVAYYTDAILLDWITQAHVWASGYKKWPFTEGRVSTTFASLVTDEDGWLRGEYPEGWKPDSIRLLTIGGKRLNKKNFYKFQSFLEDNSSTDDRIYSDRGYSYFINPTIDLSGTVTAWGQYKPYIDITDENALTVFSDAAEDGNEAIVNEILSYAHTKEKKTNDAVTYHTRATQILDGIFDSVKNEQFGYQTVDDEGMFKRIDVLAGAERSDLFNRDQF